MIPSKSWATASSANFKIVAEEEEPLLPKIQKLIEVIRLSLILGSC